MKPFAITMSGGSLGCLAYASFLETLKNEYNVVPSLLAGLSGGAVVAPFISAGCSTEEIFQIIKKLLKITLVAHHIRNFELIDHHKAIEYFRKVLPIKQFEALPIPVVIFSSNIVKQTTEVIDSGDLASAIVSSCSIYPALKPIKRLGKLLIDGGYTTFYGAKFIRERGFSKVVGIDVTGINEGNTPLFLRQFIRPLNTSVAQVKQYELQSYPVDLDIRLSVRAPIFYELEKKKDWILQSGVSAAHEYFPRIKKMLAN